ncbi:hypothetical protein [Roseinatronobacter sp. NSM]|uniref:hypothetical protein n=1 Tax=Roseinatronobacter sp. NSM TaxID=3457785 RepID=UPI0040373792
MADDNSHANAEAIRADMRAALPNGSGNDLHAAAFMVSLAILRAGDRVAAELAVISDELERARLSETGAGQ